MSIENLRAKIDEIDKEVVELFNKRMEVSAEIAKNKKETGKAVYDPARERALLTKIADMAGAETEQYAIALYSLIMELSKSYQHKIMYPESTLSKRVAEALDNTDKIFPKRAMIACQGVEGANSQIACEKLFSMPNIMYFNNFEGVFSAVEMGLCKYGILPLENSIAGSVNKIYDLMIKHNFSIVRSTRIKVDHNLLAKKGTKLSDIKEIFSHDHAINQCSEFLKSLKNVKVTVCENTAVAARMVAESDRNDIAALSSRACINLYDLECLAESVQDNGNNYTRFICISKDLEIYPGADRTSIMVVTSHRPGALYRIMSKFNAMGLNLLKIESRPLPDRDFEFSFYFDFEASVYSKDFGNMLSELENSVEDFRYFGTYSEVI